MIRPLHLRLLGAAALGALGLAGAAQAQDWPSYNRTLTSDRFSSLAEINRSNVGRLKRLCSYDVGLNTSFQAGIVVVGRTLYASTLKDTFAIDADTCALKWRAHEDFEGNGNTVSRGVAYEDGRVYRGTQDGRLIAYDAATGAKAWETKIADQSKGETVPAAPIAWKGMVFIGNAGGDYYGVKGRMYALDAASGRILWETYLVPKSPTYRGMAGAPDAGATWANSAEHPITGGATWTSYTLDPKTGLLYIPGGNPAPDFNEAIRGGDNLFTNSIVVLDARTGAYRAHYPVIPKDWHDWDVAAAPALVHTREGRTLVAVTPKDGRLHAFDLASGRRLYDTAVTTIENADTPFSTEPVRFCPGTSGGALSNGPAYSPQTNLIYTGAVDWCTTLRLMPPETRDKTFIPGKSWTGAENNLYGTKDPVATGWVSAVDADTGAIRWKFHTPNAQISGLTPTAGGLLFFGDIDGNAYALDQANGAVLWKATIETAISGGVISYAVDGKQRIAYAAGLEKRWPIAKQGVAQIVVWGLR